MSTERPSGADDSRDGDRRDGDRRDGDRRDDDLTRPLSAFNPPTRPQQQYPEPQQPQYPGPPAGQPQAWPQSQPPANREDFYPQAHRRAGAGGAFVVSLIATVVGIAASLAASYFVSHHRLGDQAVEQNLSIAGLTVWPTGPDMEVGRVAVLRLDTTQFVIAYAIAGLALLLLLWWAAGSASAGHGAFAMFLAGWGAAVVAGAISLVVAYLVATDRSQLGLLVTGAVNAGAAWGVRIGWLVGLIAAIGQSVRRRG